MITDTEQTALEMLVDRIGLSAVLEALGTICDEKADHIRSSYDDNRTARIWKRAGWRLRDTATTGSVKSVSPRGV